MIASITGPSRESASAIHSNGRPSMSPLEVGASSKARSAKLLRDAAASPRPASSRDSISSASHCSGSPSTIGDFLPSNTSVRMASQRTASPYIWAIGSASGIELGRDLQLVEGALPLAEDAEQLEQEDAKLGVGRLARGPLPAGARERRGDRRPSGPARPPPTSAMASARRPLVREARGAQRVAVGALGVYSTVILLNEKADAARGAPERSPRHRPRCRAT